MNMKLKMEIPLIHSFNRLYINILDLIDQNISKSEFSLPEVRILHETEKTENCASRMLSDTLYMDMGYLSRAIRKFEKCGSIRKEQSAIDGRAYNLYITNTDREHMAQLNNVPPSQTVHLLKPLPEVNCEFLTAHMTAIETLLTEGRNVNLQDITIRTKIRLRDVGYVICLHGYIHQEEYGYSTAFEHYVADSLVQLISQYQPGNSRLWCVGHHGNIIGCISIVGHNERVQLHRFLVDPHYRGLGLGRGLLQEAIMSSREAGYQTLFLDTTNDLNTAIAMYQKVGFKKCSEKLNDTWRKGLSELESEMSLC